jgi:hypothetical protein
MSRQTKTDFDTPTSEITPDKESKPPLLYRSQKHKQIPGVRASRPSETKSKLEEYVAMTDLSLLSLPFSPFPSFSFFLSFARNEQT